MKYRLLPIIPLLATLTCSVSFANDILGDGEDLYQSTQSLNRSLQNLGAYLGYNISEKPPEVDSGLLTNPNALQLASALSVYVMIGARPINIILGGLVPNTIRTMTDFNNYANAVYNDAGYDNTGISNNSVSINPLIDQKEYQRDPVSQAVLNILATPSNSSCLSYDGKEVNENCQLLIQGQVAANGIGPLPKPQTYYTYQSLSKILPQLNVTALTGPLIYSTQAQNQSTTSSPIPSQQKNEGLVAKSQAQAAQNFIRYAAGSLTRPALPDQQTYGTLYSKAMNLSKNTPLVEQKMAEFTLSQYFASLRAYAAHVSVGVSNLYSILAKRMPQNPGQGGTPTSQALSEFQMATGRLFSANMSNNNQWMAKINNGSSASVQKEIAVLLAEINYQLYLNRQQQEQLLLTNSLLLLQSASTIKPNLSNMANN